MSEEKNLQGATFNLNLIGLTLPPISPFTLPTGLTGVTGQTESASTNQIYVANSISNEVSVINGATNTVITTIPVGINPTGVGINPLTNRVYVTNANDNNVSVIDAIANTVIAAIAVGNQPVDVEVKP